MYGGVQAGINERSDAGKELAAADMRSGFVFPSTPPGTVSGNSFQSVPPPSITSQYHPQPYSFQSVPPQAVRFGDTTGQSSYGGFGGYGSRASAEFFGGGQSSNDGFRGGVFGGGQSSNRYHV
jgi:hypothetical protein